METYKQLINNFNAIISRLNKAEAWFKSNPDKIEDKHIDKIIELTKEGSLLAKEIERFRGVEVTQTEANSGITTYEL